MFRLSEKRFFVPGAVTRGGRPTWEASPASPSYGNRLVLLLVC